MTAVTGIHEIGSEAYHADEISDYPSLSASIAATLCNRSPLHAWTQHPRLNPNYKRQEETRFDIGTTVHALLLEDKPLEDVVSVIPFADYRKNEAKEARDDARAQGKIPLLEAHLADVVQMVAASAMQMNAVKASPPLFDAGKPEQVLVWEEDGVTCRAMLDWLRDDLATVDDFKTASDASPDTWSRRSLFNHGYDVQAAFYLRGVEALTGAKPKWRWVVQEKQPPYALIVVTPGADVLAVANAKIDYALRIWKHCLTTDEWPGYAPEIVEAELPAWADDAKWLVEAYPVEAVA